MKQSFTLCATMLLLLFSANSSAVFGQILSYTNAPDGSLNSKATNATGTGLLRVNGAQADNSCGTGFTSKNFSSSNTYSSSLSAVEVSATPDAGFSLRVTSFTADLNKIGSGPSKIRFAYSTDGGNTWIAENKDHGNRSGQCGKVFTFSWSTSVIVNAPATLKFRIYGFDAKKTSGLEQIMNLKINGTVSSSGTTTCGVPSGLGANNVTASSATLDWSDVSGATSYNIQYRVSGTSSWTSTTSTTSSASISSLTSSSNYEFQVQTVCASGTSAFSSSATFTTSAATSCGVPAGLGVSNVTATSAKLDWNDPSGATSYNIHYRVSGTSTWTNVTSTTSSVSISGLTPSSTYEFQVQTVCAAGTSAFSATSTFTTLAGTTCGVPSGLAASNVTSSSATLDWSDVSGATSYNIQYRVSGTSSWTSTTSNTSSANVSSLASSSNYEFQVQTVCASGTSAFSTSATFTTSAVTSCGVPSGLGASNVTTSSATLDWNDVSGAGSYNIQYRVSGTSTWTSTTSNTSSVSVSGLSSSTKYEYEVQTVCAGGTSVFSAIASFTTLTPTTTTIPTPDHIVVLILENHAYSQIIGSSAAPHINALSNDANSALFTQSFAIEHPSQPNYIDFYSGNNQGVTDDNVPTNIPFTTPNLGRQLINASRSFTTYSEDLPSVGYNGATSGAYARKHNPAANWMGTGTNQIPATTNQPFTAFPTDYTKLPTVSYVVPNQNNDMHDGSITTGDNWMYNNLNNYIQWAKTHNSLFILTFDEDNGSEGNRIVTIFSGSMVAKGQYSNTINHFNVLRTIEDMYGLPYAGKASTSTSITNCWIATATASAPVAMAAAKVSNSMVSVYPNPATSWVNFSFNQVPQSRMLIRIFDMTGRLKGKYELAANNKNLKVNVSAFAAGNYFYQVIQNNRQIQSGFFER